MPKPKDAWGLYNTTTYAGVTARITPEGAAELQERAGQWKRTGTRDLTDMPPFKAGEELSFVTAYSSFLGIWARQAAEGIHIPIGLEQDVFEPPE